MPMSKKTNKEEIELDQYLTKLTDIGLETESEAIFQLTETVRDSDLFKSEREVLESFLEWAKNESSKFVKVTGIDLVESNINPNQGDLFPKKEPMSMAIIREIKNLIDGTHYRSKLDSIAVSLARTNGIVIMYGESDDILSFQGVIDDEAGAYNGLSYKGLEFNEAFPKDIKELMTNHQIELIWHDEGQKSWSFKVDERSKFERFNIMEDGEVFSEGLILVVNPKTQDV